ncbi:MAG: PTS sugar transporter subunit IIA [Pseudomonadota bacterium]
MIGIVIVTHGGLAQAFGEVLAHIVGPQEQVAVVPIAPDDDMRARRMEIVAAIKDVDRGAGVAVLTDMFGGTPSNLAISVMGLAAAQADPPPGAGGDDAAAARASLRGVDVEVIAGLNLPLLVKLASIRDKMTLPEAAAAAQEAGRRYIAIASQMLAS